MNTTDEQPKPVDNMELLKQRAEGCGAGCSCHCSGASGKIRWVICILVLVVAGVLVVRAVTKAFAAVPKDPATAFALPAEGGTPRSDSNEATPAEAVPPVDGASVGTMIGTFAELNSIAAGSDAVFVYIPGKQAGSVEAPASTMQAAARTMQARGTKCALFTLKAGSPDYDKLGPQVSMPGVLALVKGKGMSAVSGEITETKLIQGYVAAANAGGCGPSGCGPSGCP